MPNEPRISVHEYIDARLDAQDDRIELKILEVEDQIKLRDQKILIELRETRAWVLLLTAPAWATFVQDWASNEVGTAVAMLAFVFGLIGIAFYRTRKPVIPKDAA